MHTAPTPPPLLLLSPAAPVDLLALESSDAILISPETQAQARAVVDATIPADLWSLLLPHQQEGVLAGVRRGGRLLLADEMGLGKTAQVCVSIVDTVQHACKELGTILLR